MFFSRSKQFRRLPALVVLPLVIAGLATRSAFAQEPPTVDSILRDWRQRQEQFQTLSFRWTTHTTHPKGSLPGKVGGSGGTAPVGQGPQVAPPTDVTQTEQMTLKVRDAWMRYTRDGPQWVPDVQKFLQKRYESSFDGSDSKAFYEGSKEESTVHHLGFINLEKKCQDITNYEIWPVLLHYRPVHPTIGRLASAQWVILQSGVTLRGRECILLKNTVPSDMEETCWVDAARKCSILRHVLKAPSRMIQTDIDYREDPEYGWVPSSWAIQDLAPDTGAIEYASTAEVAAAALNQPIPEDEFRLVFPPGTEVYDAPVKQYYLVRPDGSKRTITQEERLRGGNYDEFLKTESGQAHTMQAAAWGPWRILLVASVPTLIAVATGFVLLRRFGRTKAGKGSSH